MIEHGTRTIGELRQEMSRIRRLGGRPVTNYFNQCSQCDDPLECWVGEKACVFIWNDEEVRRVYFYAVDREELAQALALPGAGSCLDYLSRELEENRELFLNAGYKLYAEYGRYVFKNLKTKITDLQKALFEDAEAMKELFESNYGERAKVEDAEEIDACIRRHFDPYRSHFYDMETLRENIRKGWVWVARENGKIIAGDLYEVQGNKRYGAYLFNEGSVESLTSLIAVTDRAAILQNGGDFISYYCWMNMANKRALRYNVVFCGAVFDNLYDSIYIKEGKEDVE